MKKIDLREDCDTPSASLRITPKLAGLLCEYQDSDSVLIPWRNTRILHSKTLVIDSEFKQRLASFPLARITINGMRNVETFWRLRRRSCLRTFKNEGFTWNCVNEWGRSGPLILFGVVSFLFGTIVTEKAMFQNLDEAFLGLNATQRECYTALTYFCCYGTVVTFWGTAFACLFATRHHLKNLIASDRVDKVVLDNSTLTFWFQSKRSIKIRLSEISKITRTGFVCVDDHESCNFAFRPLKIRDWAIFAKAHQEQIESRKRYEQKVLINWTRVFRIVFWVALLGSIYLAVDILAIVTEQNWLRLTTPVIAAGLLQTIGFGDDFFDYVFYAAKVKLGLRPRRSPRPFATAILNTK